MAVTVDTERCVGCGCCSDVCRAGALEFDRNAVVHTEHCTECGSCMDMCPAGALSL